jgi:cadmium resistance protein CadD (predicted permease)
MDFFSVIGLGIVSFIATNLDDMLILMTFFANIRFPPFQVILGQYVGMGALLAVALAGSLISLIVPNNLLGLMGLFPIAIGIRELVELWKINNDKEPPKNPSQSRWIAVLPFLTVAAVTFSGGEEIGIYTTVFATNNAVDDMIIIISVAMVLTAIWCGLAAYFVKHSYIADRFRAVSTKVLPFILIGLGIYILAEAFLPL